ncbi:MAG TPA: SDR family oxidoreductase [Rhodothermales bacterium]|nr:SDR family oxidoreductase [Rhodothermales bacterium]
MAKTISILGCGWLGLPLGQHLVQHGYHVKGSTTTPEKLDTLAEADIEPYLIELAPGVSGKVVSDFFRADVLFLNIPPGRWRPDVEAHFGAQMDAVIKELHYSSIGFVVFASSTSVYEDMNGVVVEADAGKPRPWSLSGRALLDAECRLQADTHFDTTILRLAGLYGHGRHPGRFLAGRKDLDNGGAPVNLVHRDDVIAIAAQVITDEVRGAVFNVCADVHPMRKTFYRQAARHLGLEPPTFASDEATSYKIVSNEQVKKRLGYQFQHPDPATHAP